MTEPLKAIQSPSGRYGALGVWSPSDRYLFGSGTEIAARQPEAKYDLKNPQTHSPRFTAIRPGASGQNANEPNPIDHSSRRPSGHKFGTIPR